MKTGTSIRLLRPLLACGSLRRRLAMALRVYYFSDLGLSLPLSHGLDCPLAHEEERISLAEIFFEGVYDDFLDEGPLPERWIDLGCHAGYFSLWLEWRRRRAGLTSPSAALLVDADSRRMAGVTHLIELNRLTAEWSVVHGAIAKGSGSLTFYERDFMASSATSDNSGSVVTVPILTPEKIRALFPPPYDLIKVDIEGGEVEFLACYETLWRDAKKMLLEWHGPCLGSEGLDGLLKRLRAGGFSRIEDFGPSDQSGGTPKFGHLLASRV
jgi:FkbM family methyltransferase